MPPLHNPRHERFCIGLSEGKSAHQAYADAGYKPHDGNCIRLRGNERVHSRLAELQAEAAKTAKVTVESLLAELEEARTKATSLDQLSAAVRAVEAKAKISGVLVERQQVEVNHSYYPGDMSISAILDHVAAECGLEAAQILAKSCDVEYQPAVIDVTPPRARHSQRVSQRALEETKPSSTKREI